ncbi:angiopoietin-related protein 7-like [Ruditapes philippinarum]|uniref:angiopoietin-related protein 7-like n=1 Tax=Ruditapes philippinarum TaxID=129788 RepID=UPI00295B605B|nr:angiopoietin-related protein 7-like [Ruditapes philippinarum]
MNLDFIFINTFLLSVCVYVTLGADSWTCTANTDSNESTSTCKNLEKRFKTLEIQMKQVQKLLQTNGTNTYTTIDGIPKDCEAIYENGPRTDGMYMISPDGRCPFLVYCDMKNGGWTVIQRRIDGRVSFYRPWDGYVSGFGDLDGSFWLGLEKIHRLTRDGSQIYFDMENYDGSRDYAHYNVFTVHEAATAYRMNVDAFGYRGSIRELLSYHNNQKFSTYDRDNDANTNGNCVISHGRGGWWYNTCYMLGNLNGIYGKREVGGVGYYDGDHLQIKNVEMKVKAMHGVC